MASWWQKTLMAAAGLAGAVGGAYYFFLRRPVPSPKGVRRLPGLHEEVEVITDRYGVPHIYARNEDDLFFAQGYVHAQQRLWQMDFNRRLGSGRLSEVVGEVTLELDRFCRRLGLHRAAASDVARLSAHHRRILETYAAGVNAFIENHTLPVEFTLLRYRPDPWQPADSLLWAKMMGWNLSGNWESELIRARIVARAGAERAAKLEAGYDPSHPLIIPPGAEYGGANPGLLEPYEQVKLLSGFGPLGASNNWVVDGSKTVTGAPILCNDPHLAQGAPSIWFECHLAAGDIDVIGASFPGTPGIVIGHNRHIAWGLTNAISDVQDLYIEKFDPQHPYRYEFRGQWEEAQVIREEIHVKGRKEPVVEEVVVTRHGPILTTLPTSKERASEGDGATPSELPLALRWTGFESCRIIAAVEKLNRATCWEEFLEAMSDWDVPPQNVVYADREGNIGYIMAGLIPVRSHRQTLLPSPGWTGEYEWTGFIPFEELPRLFNPPEHLIVTANNRVVKDDYPYYITHEWLNGYRAQRIRDLLQSKERLSLADMARIQSDQYALPAREIVPQVLETVSPANALEETALQTLRDWDYVLSPDSAGAAIYETFLQKLERIVFGAVIGDDEQLLYQYLGVGSTLLAILNGYASRSKPLLIRLLKERDDTWFAESAIPNGPRSWHAAISAAWSAAIAELLEKLGPDVTRWQYGAIHRLTYQHPLGNVKPLDKLFNRGPYPAGGDIDTVFMGAVVPNQPEQVVIVPSYRQIVNLADLNASLSGHAPGQSGHPGSRHYGDFVRPWLRTEHHPMLFERQAIEANMEGHLLLQPR
ncbi:peptidase S45 [Thermogemmatispora aurantia]|uniref:Peptidase S45 n=1 Tax=Thermogemmatispora aurantia TaxID=2045279 RepID=A0A5J4K679_9CHLR|nr:penicillin acylase family protein [Thermogemmatispora aurantia]GER82160.1 peptidase S45 [Thermogemmatispora aurantia]